ncbi:tRNA nucleotidyltransferase (CCA-adding enzyme) [Halovenus aranensis]|uniref:CCA-adding enzyme n=1 Tax=Halovenus aranensis TaxID=890420 RepID=A0A1G8URM0_9EURY|nr:CCA tRNA nucleotidyltransferase [Halovenus aranensis]SDJ56314.1 tRNA nucleotidyltransferase (CCA-adding enzyme) [Halovenus aranensis]
MSDEDSAFDAVVADVAERVDPDGAERQAMEEAVQRLRERTAAALSELPVDAEVMQVGSTARDTWLAGERDIDLFVCFPTAIDSDELERYGLDVGHSVLPDGREEFAEHPYVVGEVDGFDVDLVPCYAVDSASDIRSSVDRTPFHTRYLRERMTPALASDVRVCKQFMRGIGVYGSDLKTKGFSGYLTELLVLEHGGFRGLVEAAADWSPPVRFDPADHGTASFADPVVVIDPTDPERNVAAVLSRENVARFQHFARELLDEPRDGLFRREEVEPLSASAVRERFTTRGTTPLALRLDRPDIVEDQLWPQLERSKEGIGDELVRRGFDIFRTDAFADDETVVLLFELAVAERPAIERHTGPPVHVQAHAGRFYDGYAESDAYGPFIEDDRYVVERERAFTSAASFLDSDALYDVALGAHIESAIEDSYEVLDSDDVPALADRFGRELARYLSPSARG